ncbi:MAG TPA: CaiB/BaiF CoA-transferase family protein [Reyranella sp.]|nr:CaiB/BaiF CoA-transferase family protein [Reyranella sp.]
MSSSGRPPLSGIRVIDFTRVIAGPLASQILSDMGADVIKIENPDGGDDTRKGAGPRAGGPQGESHFFMTYNRGKKSVALDFTKPEGQAVVHRILADTDVLLQNFRPGVMKKYGLDWQSLHQKYPRLIYLSISAYGQTGPLSDRPGYDPVLQGESGMMSVNGEANGEGLRHAIAVVDTMTGIHSVAAINAALYARDAAGRGTNRGQHIDLALFDTALACLGNMGSYYLIGGEEPRRAGNSHFASAPNGSFETRNGKIYMAVANQKLFVDTCKALGHPEWATDPRFATIADRVANKPLLMKMMEDVLRTDTKENWAEKLRHLPAGPIRTMKEALDNPEVKRRGMLKTYKHSRVGEVPIIGSNYRFSDTPVDDSRPPPALGEHTDKVLGGIAGLSPEEIKALREKKVIG